MGFEQIGTMADRLPAPIAETDFSTIHELNAGRIVEVFKSDALMDPECMRRIHDLGGEDLQRDHGILYVVHESHPPQWIGERL